MKWKKSIWVVFAISLFLVLPLSVQANTFELSGTDMSVEIDDSEWLVFTRDTIEDDAMMEELGASYDDLHDILYNNDAYMDAVLYGEYGDFVELIIRKTEQDPGKVNLSNYSDEDVLEFAEALAERQGADDYSIYETEYKFVRAEYKDKNVDYYICEYVTIVNKESYTLTFQSPTKYDEEDYEVITEIVESVSFDVDASLKEKTQDSFGKTVMFGAIKGAIIGGISGGLAAWIIKITKAKKNKKEEQ